MLVRPSTRDASLSCNEITYNTIHIICHAIMNFYTEPFETNSLKILIVEAFYRKANNDVASNCNGLKFGISQRTFFCVYCTVS